MTNQDDSKQKPKGVVLREAREEKGLDLVTVHEATKIPLDILRAIEEGYTVRTLSPFYLKGFMKMYAQYLGVDISQIVDDYKREELPEKIDGDIDKQEDIEEKITTVLPRELQQQLVKGAAVLVALFLVFKMGGCVKRRWLGRKPAQQTDIRTRRIKKPEEAPFEKDIKAPAKAASPAKEVKTAPPKPAAAQPAPVAPSGTVQTPAAVQPPAEKKPAKPVTLTVTVKKKGWLQVKVDGTVVFQSTINEGAKETWEAEKSIELSGKSIQDLDFVLNGKELSPLGRADRNARRLIVTPQGISIKKL